MTGPSDYIKTSDELIFHIPVTCHISDKNLDTDKPEMILLRQTRSHRKEEIDLCVEQNCSSNYFRYENLKNLELLQNIELSQNFETLYVLAIVRYHYITILILLALRVFITYKGYTLENRGVEVVAIWGFEIWL